MDYEKIHKMLFELNGEIKGLHKELHCINSDIKDIKIDTKIMHSDDDDDIKTTVKRIEANQNEHIEILKQISINLDR